MEIDSAQVPGGVGAPMAQLNHLLYRADVLAQTQWEDFGDVGVADFLYTLEQIQRRLAKVQGEVLAVAQRRQEWVGDGARSVTTWLCSLTGVSRVEASRRVRLSRGLHADLPLTLSALGEGKVGAEHARILQREGTKTPKLREQLRDEHMGEAFLLGVAESLNVDDFRKAVKHWAVLADPQAADRNWREQTQNEEVFLSAVGDMYYLSGQLNAITGRALQTALDAHMGRKAEGDDRTRAQRRAAALGAWAHSWLDSGALTPRARIRPHLNVHVPFETLAALCQAVGSAVPASGFTPGASAFGSLHAPGGPKKSHTSHQGTRGEENFDPEHWVNEWGRVNERGGGGEHVISTAIDYDKLQGVPPATLDDGTALAPNALARLACGSMLMRTVFGPQSTIIDVGREERIFPANQTRAIIARDKHCQYPSCSEPPEFGEIHHSLWWWRHNGKTCTDQGILLCWHHHSYVHANNIMITRTNGAWVFCDDQGRIITGTSHRPRTVVGPQHELPLAKLQETTATGPGAQTLEQTNDTRTDDAGEFSWEVPPGLAWPLSEQYPSPQEPPTPPG